MSKLGHVGLILIICTLYFSAHSKMQVKNFEFNKQQIKVLYQQHPWERHANTLMIINKEFQENLSQPNHNGQYSIREVRNQEYRIKQYGIEKGKYKFIEMKKRTARGFATLYFARDKKGIYQMYDSSFSPFRILKSGSVCGYFRQDFADNWKQFASSVEKSAVVDMIKSSNSNFLDPSCSQGNFAKVHDDFVDGIASVMLSDSDESHFIGCLNKNNMNDIAIRMQAKFEELLRHNNYSSIMCTQKTETNAIGLYDPKDDIIIMNKLPSDAGYPAESNKTELTNTFFHEMLHMTNFEDQETIVGLIENCCGLNKNNPQQACDQAKDSLKFSLKLEQFLQQAKSVKGWDDVWYKIKNSMDAGLSRKMMENLIAEYVGQLGSNKCITDNNLQNDYECNLKIVTNMIKINSGFFNSEKCWNYAYIDQPGNEKNVCSSIQNDFNSFLNQQTVCKVSLNSNPQWLIPQAKATEVSSNQCAIPSDFKALFSVFKNDTPTSSTPETGSTANGTDTDTSQDTNYAIQDKLTGKISTSKTANQENAVKETMIDLDNWKAAKQSLEKQEEEARGSLEKAKSLFAKVEKSIIPEARASSAKNSRSASASNPKSNSPTHETNVNFNFGDASNTPSSTANKQEPSKNSLSANPSSNLDPTSASTKATFPNVKTDTQQKSQGASAFSKKPSANYRGSSPSTAAASNGKYNSPNGALSSRSPANATPSDNDNSMFSSESALISHIKKGYVANQKYFRDEAYIQSLNTYQIQILDKDRQVYGSSKPKTIVVFKNNEAIIRGR